MMHKKEDRAKLLLALYRKSGGDPNRHLSVDEVSEAADELSRPSADLAVVARQLAAMGFLKPLPAQDQLHPETVYTITARGIEEGERMERPFERWTRDHPILFESCRSIAIVILTTFLSTAMLLLLGWKR